jgi:hypothetical protein
MRPWFTEKCPLGILESPTCINNSFSRRRRRTHVVIETCLCCKLPRGSVSILSHCHWCWQCFMSELLVQGRTPRTEGPGWGANKKRRKGPSELEMKHTAEQRNKNATSSTEMKGKASPTKILDKIIWNPRSPPRDWPTAR